MRNIGPLVHKGSGQLRILYSFPLRVGAVGIGMTAWHQVTALLHQAVHVRLYAGSCEGEIQGLDGLKETLVFGGIKLPLRLLGTKRAVELHDRIVARNLPRIHDKDRIDIVHCWPSGALETLRTARKLGIKTVLERPSSHTGYVFKVNEDECTRLGVKLKRSHYAAFNERKLAHEESEFVTADRLLCPSDFVVKTFLEKGFKNERLLRHQYGYDPEIFSPPTPGSDKRNGSPFTMVYVGDCFPLKGLHFALQAWVESKASKTGKFIICGRFVPRYKELLKDYLNHPTVEYLGHVRDVQRVMVTSHALVLPSLAEGSALVTYEARACGCVLLVSEASGAKCTHMHDALVHKVGDVPTLRTHIDMLASDRRLLKRLRDNSLATVSELTWEKAADSLIRAYRKCLDGK
jgi:glycosyltransferase involved in cell wall biosynthesis